MSRTSEAGDGASGSYSYAAIGRTTAGKPAPTSKEEEARQVKIERAMRSGPRHVTRDARIVEMGPDGTLVTLREGTNEWTCFPGDADAIGSAPMCCDPQGLIWMMDGMAGKQAPTNTEPGLIYMLCGATQHSTTKPGDTTGPAIPIGPHWMITWPYNAAKTGLPATARDAGAWVMYDGTTYAYLHICGSPWVGNEYDPSKAAIWTMRYGDPIDPE